MLLLISQKKELELCQKKILIIAGPNGAGKTTLTLYLLSKEPDLYEFINADEIAKGLAPQNPESMALTAGKLMISRLKALLKVNKSFAFETTGAGKNYLDHLKSAKSKGYEILLVFLWLDDPKQAINLETAIEDGKVMQDFDPESFPTERSFTIWECSPSVERDSKSKSCITLPSSIAVSRIKELLKESNREDIIFLKTSSLDVIMPALQTSLPTIYPWLI